MKTKTQFICQKCGASSLKWQGQCSQCKSWNSLIEEAVKSSRSSFPTFPANNKPSLLSEPSKGKTVTTVSTGIRELNRVLGQGLVSGSYILLGGAPGIGKSTLLLQMADSLSRQKLKVFYVSAEESVQQTRLRAARLNLKHQDQIFVLNETSLETIFHHIKQIKPNVLIVDSIQTVQIPEIGSTPGTMNQVRECSVQLMNFAKNTQTSVFVIGHITKEGSLAGPRVLEHMVDTVLSFDGDPHHSFRLLRVLKNRFGPTNEIGVFQMTSTGLHEVDNPSELFLEERGKQSTTGSVVFTTVEGSRPLTL